MTNEERYRLDDERFIPTGFALDRLGLHLYPATWIGCHVGWDRPEDPGPTLKRNRALKSYIADADRAIGVLSESIAGATNAEERKSLEALREKKLQGRSKAFQELDSKSAITDESVKEYEYFSKIELAQELLEQAMRREGLDIFTSSGGGLSLGRIENERGMHVRVRDSYFIDSRVLGKRRRGIIMLDRERFMDWLSKVVPAEAAPGKPLTPEQAFRAEVRELAQTGEKPKSASQYRDDARRRISGLTKSVAKRVWDEEVPQDWLRPGRRPAAKK